MPLKPYVNALILSSTRRKFLLGSVLLCLSVIVFAALVWGGSVEEGRPDSDTGSSKSGESAPVSAADCSHVPYGEPDKAAKKMLKDPNPKGATRVGVDFHVEQITEIDPVTNTFNIEGFMDLVWCDPRQKDNRKLHFDDDAEAKLNEIWWPDLILANQDGAREPENRALTIRPDGTIDYKERFAARLDTHYNFKEFPFDTQRLRVEIESFVWTAKEVRFLNEEGDYDSTLERVRLLPDEATHRLHDFDIPEWDIIRRPSATVQKLKEERHSAEVSQFTVKITVERHEGFHLLKMMLPLIVIALVSWSVFWMTGESLSSRMGIAMTGILTVVAYQFVTSNFLPDIEYLTFWDALLMLSLALMALTVAENIFVPTPRLWDREKPATKIDRTCRWVFPLVYVAGVGVLATILEVSVRW